MHWECAMAYISALFLLLATFIPGLHCEIPKYRIRHVDSDLSLKIEDNSVILAKYSPNEFFWWNIAIDEVGKLSFYNQGSMLFLKAVYRWKVVLRASELSMHDYSLVQWHYLKSGAIRNAKNPNLGIAAPKNVKSGDEVQLSKASRDEFALELILASGDPVRLSGTASYQRFMKHFEPPHEESFF